MEDNERREGAQAAPSEKEYTSELVEGGGLEFFEDADEYRHPEDHLTRFEHICLNVRNVLAGIAAVLFIISIFPLHIGISHHDIQAVAYFFGAGAYIAELVEMSDEEKRASKHHRRRVFMPNLFGALYIILGISHLFD